MGGDASGSISWIGYESQAAAGSLDSSDWEGPFMQKLGLAADFGAPLIEETLAGKPGERAGLRRGAARARGDRGAARVALA